jgi:hypothetical protein
MCFGSRSTAASDNPEPMTKPIVVQKEKKPKLSQEEKDKIKMEKGFAAMAAGNSAAAPRRCC